MRTWIIFLLFFNLYCVNTVIINTPLGRILGKTKIYNNRPVIQFLNVPYAEPPVGYLRFQKPIPVKPWSGILNATEYGPSCVQNGLPSHDVSEDCLVVNIYVPNNVDTKSSKAVMVYLHGGGYTVGQGKSQDGSLLALMGDVIVITINYRLDVFGFLATGHGDLPGNYGLWDQRESFLWVKNNIAAFGGNPNSVTIFGESAGALSVGLHLVSNKTTGLFQRALCESGVTLSPLVLAFDPVAFAKRFVANVGCLSSPDIKSCLVTKTSLQILKASQLASKEHLLAFRLLIGPVVDGDFLTKNPLDLITESDIPFGKVDLLAGTNSAEGIIITYTLLGYQVPLRMNIKQGIPSRVFCDNITTSLSRDYYRNSNVIANEICQLYSRPGISDSVQARQVIDMYGDMIFLAPTVSVLDIHSKVATSRSTYQYYFSHVASSSTLHDQYPWFVGVPHGGELAFVFGPAVSFHHGTTYTQAEVVFSNKLQVYWTNFAKHGNPNDLHLERWPSYSSQRNYLDLNLNIVANKTIFPDRMKLWLSLDPTQQDAAAAQTMNLNTAVYTAVSTMLGVFTLILHVLI